MFILGAKLRNTRRRGDSLNMQITPPHLPSSSPFLSFGFALVGAYALPLALQSYTSLTSRPHLVYLNLFNPLTYFFLNDRKPFASGGRKLLGAFTSGMGNGP